MDGASAAELEVAIADAGQLLAQLDTFTDALRTPYAPLMADLLALGDRARGRHHAGTLDEPAAAVLRDEAVALRARLGDALRTLRAHPTVRAAVAAHRAGDHPALARLLPLVLAGIEAVPAPPDLYRGVAWVARNRPRPPADIAAEVGRLRQAGIDADGDALAMGIDPELPAVALMAVPSGEEPLVLRFRGADLPPAVFRLVDGNDYLVHVPRLQVPFAIELPESLDEELVGDVVADLDGYRRALASALADAGLVPRS